MQLEHLAATFEALDTLSVETLALFLHTDRRPLRGAAGIVDWRLCGELSRAILAGGLTGKLGERLLMPTHGRIGAQRLLLFGAGPSKAPLDAGELGRALELAGKAGARDLAVELPDNASTDAASEAVRRFGGARLIVVGAPDALRERLGGRASEPKSARPPSGKRA